MELNRTPEQQAAKIILEYATDIGELLCESLRCLPDSGAAMLADWAAKSQQYRMRLGLYPTPAQQETCIMMESAVYGMATALATVIQDSTD